MAALWSAEKIVSGQQFINALKDTAAIGFGRTDAEYLIEPFYVDDRLYVRVGKQPFQFRCEYGFLPPLGIKKRFNT